MKKLIQIFFKYIISSSKIIKSNQIKLVDEKTYLIFFKYILDEKIIKLNSTVEQWYTKFLQIFFGLKQNYQIKSNAFD